MTSLDETILLAYVDGQLPPEEVESVERALKTDPQAQAVVDKMRATAGQIRPAFDASLSRPLPPHLTNTVLHAPLGRHKPARISIQSAAMIAVAVLLVGVGIGLFAGYETSQRSERLDQDDWVQAVIDYQVLYGRQTLSRPSPSPDKVRDLQRYLGDVLASQISIPDLSDAGLMFKRGQILVFDEVPIAQLAYLPNKGKPVAYCITPSKAVAAGMQAGQSKGLHYVRWNDGRLAHVIVGGGSKEELQEMALRIRRLSGASS